MNSIEHSQFSLEDLKLFALRRLQLINQTQHQLESTAVEHISFSPTKMIDVQRVKRTTVSSPTPQLAPITQLEKEYELERQQQVQKAIRCRLQKFQSFSEQQIEQNKKERLQREQNFINSMKNQEAGIIQGLKEYEKQKSRSYEELMTYCCNLEEKTRKSVEALEAKELKRRELITTFLDHQSKFYTTQEVVIENIKKSNGDKNESLINAWKKMKSLNDLMKRLSDTSSNNRTEEEVKTAEMISLKAIQLKHEIDEILAKLQKEAVAQIESEKAILATTDTVQKVRENKLSNCVSTTNFKRFSDIFNFYENYTAPISDLLRDDRYKKFRLDCKKAINLTVNAVSAVNSLHLNDKYIKLSRMLQGQLISIGDFRINPMEHPSGIRFCTTQLAEKFVLQGDLMISSNPEAAFSFATLMVTLCNESQDFANILLHYFYKECPYVVPFFIPRAVGQKDEDYYKAQAYRYVDGQIEEQDKFLKRMTGILRLYFAMMMSTPKGEQTGNLFNMKVAWNWLASMLKLEPRIGITATSLHTFFETVGFEMQKIYNKQFFELMKTFEQQYLPALAKLDSGGPVTRLQCMMQEMKKTNSLKAAKGILPKNFW